MTKNFKRILSILLCVAMAAALLAGCGASSSGSTAAPAANSASAGSSAPAAAPAERHVELTMVANMSNTVSVFTLNPAVQYQGGHSVNIGVCETLFTFNDDMSDVEGILATGYEVSADGLTWTIPIREGVKFSNGKDLDAARVKAAMEYTLENIARFSSLLDVADIEADGQTLTIHTNNVVPGLVNYLTDTNFLIWDVEVNDDLDHNIIGTGAYILESVDDDGNCELVRNDNYWRCKPIAERIHTKCGMDNTAIALALQSGEVDWGTIGTSDVALFTDTSRYTTRSIFSNGRVYYGYFNTNRTFTADPAVREALYYAVDREAIVLGVYSGYGTVANTIYPESSNYYDGTYAPADFDAARAASILEAAGYVDTDGDGIREKDGQKLHLNITTYSANNFPVLAEVMQSMLLDVGIESDIVISGAIMDDLRKGEFNIAVYAYNTLAYADVLNYLDPVYRTGGNSNFNGFSDPIVDANLDALRSETNIAKREALTAEIQKQIYTANTHMYFMHVMNFYVSNAKVIETAGPIFGTYRNAGQYLWSLDKQ